jgi:ribosomal protein S18 acetylase RimI-like enzyme
MILVHPDRRRLGVATALIRASLDYLQTAQVRCVKLDATEQGRLVYLTLGFEDERPIYRYIGPRLPGLPAGQLPPIEEADWENIARLDADVVGAGRLRLLRLLAKDGATAVVKTSQGIRGYGFARRGFKASFLGPIVADSVDVARSLTARLLARFPDGGHGVYWDVLADNAAARELAESLGFHVERRLTRMRSVRGERHGTPDCPGVLNMIYGAAGFEVG